MIFNTELANFVAMFEGKRYHGYFDTKDIPTIGIGFTFVNHGQIIDDFSSFDYGLYKDKLDLYNNGALTKSQWETYVKSIILRK